MSKPTSNEQRRSKRRPILDTFSVFVVIHPKGGHRLKIDDLSEVGIGFELDAEGESPADFKIAKGETLQISLYLNQSLYIPLSVKVVRIDEGKKTRRVGAEFSDASSKSVKAVTAFIQMLDQVVDAAQLKQD